MGVTATTREGAAALLGMPGGPDGIPCRRDLAEAVRRIVGARGAAPKDAVASSVVETCRALGHPLSAIRPALDHVVADLILAGDLASITCDGAEALAPKPGRQVVVAPGLAAALGAVDVPATVSGRPEAAVRLAPVQEGAIRLADELGAPSYRQSLSAMGLPHGPSITLADFAGLVFHELVRAGVETEPASVETLGRLPGDGTRAFGRVASGGARRPAALRLLGDGTVIALPLPDLEALAWLALSGMGVAGRRFSWVSELVPPPRQLAAALTIAGVREAVGTWLLPEGADTELAEWIGAAIPEEEAPQEGDPSQRAVVAAALDARLLVEAGPGSGKTWVACRRTARLVEEGVPPARIVVVSFTRAAVGELRERIASFLPDPATANDLAVWTLDSLAWRLRSGFSGEEDGVPAGGYEANVRETLDMLAVPGGTLADFLEGIGHLVVDEAQDLVGTRRELVLALIDGLSRECGVTVFMDSAQAIYGWQEGKGSVRQDLIARGFVEVRLDADHRTRTRRLKSMFAECRRALLDCGAAPATYQHVRETIEGHADGMLSDAREGALGSTLMLFRSRAELLSAASDLWSVGAQFGVRLSGRRPAIEPWVAAALSGVADETISRPMFDALWDELWPPPVGVSRDAAWAALRKAAPSGSVAVDMVRLRARLSAPVPPPCLSVREHGYKGLVLSTIHGAKGREADHVRLMMPRAPTGEGADWGEEARILFVGATRARKTLRVGSSFARLSDPNRVGRLWREAKFSTGRNARVEIGSEGDVDEAAQVLAESWGGAPDRVSAAQTRLWSLAGRQARIAAERVPGTDAYALAEEDGDGTVLGFLAPKVLGDLLSIGNSVHGGGAAPPWRIRGLNLIGVRTVAAGAPLVDAAEPHRRSGLWLVPMVAGVAAVFFRTKGGGDA